MICSWGFHRLGKGTLYRPTEYIQPCGQGTVLDTCSIGPLFHGESFSVECNQMIPSAVITLLARCSPAAILRGIWAIIVYPVKAMAIRWRVAHVIIECFKRLLPALAYLYAASSIVLITLMVRIGAAFKHTSPRVVRGRIGHAVRGGRSARTATGGRFTRFKVAPLNHAYSATVAPACPKISFPTPICFLASISKYKPVVETLAREVFDVFGGWDKLIISHCNSLLVMVVRGVFSAFNIEYLSFIIPELTGKITKAAQVNQGHPDLYSPALEFDNGMGWIQFPGGLP